jgi:Phosphotransferase enzyme family
MPGTHAVELGPTVVVKRYRSWSRGEHRREWRALTLLAEYAPGLAPEPVRADLTAEPPSVTMSRVAGTPLAGPLTTEQVDGLADAVHALQHAVPPEVLHGLPHRLLHPRDALRYLRRRCARRPPPGDDPLVGRAFAAVSDWVARPRLDAVFDAEPAPVFGTGDGNLANHLWDGSQVRMVDFEFSGRGDRAYELAELVEHVTAWVDGALDAEALLSRFTLTAAETARLRESRRLLALFWFLTVLADDTERPRDPPGSATRQAGRLLALLDD